jgi:phosphoglycerol transferase MdoB-like AlkP superfamily enzyme
MPRFGTKSLLIGFALVALWLSTLYGGPASRDIRDSILLFVLVASAFAAIYFRGRTRAFWAAFLVVLLLTDASTALRRWLPRSLPDISWHENYSGRWANQLSNDPERQSILAEGIFSTIQAAWRFALAAAAGLIAITIYDNGHKHNSRDSD